MPPPTVFPPGPVSQNAPRAQGSAASPQRRPRPRRPGLPEPPVPPTHLLLLGPAGHLPLHLRGRLLGPLPLLLPLPFLPHGCKAELGRAGSTALGAPRWPPRAHRGAGSGARFGPGLAGLGPPLGRAARPRGPSAGLAGSVQPLPALPSRGCPAPGRGSGSAAGRGRPSPSL